jgi:hypothetical protein
MTRLLWLTLLVAAVTLPSAASSKTTAPACTGGNLRGAFTVI